MFQREFLFRALALGFSAVLAACGGATGGGASSSAAGSSAATSSASGGSAGGSTSSSSGGTTTVASCEQLFAQRVQPRLDFCRSCHVPGGVADVPDGKLYQLSSDKIQDYAKLRSSWEALGRNDSGKSRILKMASGTDTRSHTGGAPWPVGSDAYKEMDAQLLGFVDATACNLGAVGGPVPEQLPLLDLGPRSTPDALACGQPDVTPGAAPNTADSRPLPVDPRSLVVPTLDTKGGAVQFNAWWIDVHNPAPPFLKNPLQRPKTCGEWNAQVATASLYLKELAMAGKIVTAAQYNRVWRDAWALSARPADFDQETVQRYGLAPARHRNPYPLVGEDPATTDGGSGQLPLGLVQMRGADGKYNGDISMNCSICHESELGTPADGPGFGTVYGRGNDNFDMGTMLSDFTKVGGSVTGAVPVPLAGTTRGLNDPTAGFEVVYAIRDLDTMSLFPSVKPFPLHSAPGGVDAPTWSNLAFRPRKFVSADVPGDEIRAMQTFLLSDTSTFSDGAKFKAEAPKFENVKSYIEALPVPAYPKAVDTAKAEAGAILFHTKDLWANGGNADIPKPPGNGSCAGCHGAYSPRYVNDPSILPDPRLKGVAAYMVSLDIIGTDPNRAEQVGGPQADSMRASWDTGWSGYSELNPQYASSSQTDGTDPLTQAANDYLIYQPGAGGRVAGPNTWQKTENQYLAPPLRGVWMSAPYFHNGSVPDVWGVLDPAKRPAVWQRLLTAPGESGINRGFDRSLNAYDFDKLGWKYAEIPCDSTGVLAAASCTPGLDPVNALLATLGSLGGSTSWLSYLYLPPLTQQQVESRMVYNTHQFSQNNAGHRFTQVLTDAERRALIEYLKTL